MFPASLSCYKLVRGLVQTRHHVRVPHLSPWHHRVKFTELQGDQGFIRQLRLSLSSSFHWVRFLLQHCVYYKHTFITVKLSRKKHHKIFEWRIFQWILRRYFLWLSDICINTSVSEDHSSSEYSSDSDGVNDDVRPTKRQKSLVIDSAMGSENEMMLENAPLLPKKSVLNIVFHENDFTGVLGIIVECSNPQSISEITIFGQQQ